MRSEGKMKSIGWILGTLLVVTGVVQGEGRRGADIHFRGPIFAITRDADDTAVSLKIEVNQSQVEVQLSRWTEVIAGRGFSSTTAALQLRDFVEVDGFFTSTGKIVAERIHLETPDPLELEGVIDGGQGELLQVSGIEFVIDSSSIVRRSGGKSAEPELEFEPGMAVRLRARNVSGAWTISEIVAGPRTVATEPLRLEGKVTAIEHPVYLKIDVGITEPSPVDAVVLFDSDTEFGSQVGVGDFVLIEGRFYQNSAALLATRVSVDVNRNGNNFDDGEDALNSSPSAATKVELHGTVRGRQGPMNGVRFYINETEVRAGSGTQVRVGKHHGSLADVRDGLELEVHGTWVATTVGGRHVERAYVEASHIQIEGEEEEADDESGEDVGDEDQNSGAEAEGSIASLVREHDGSVSSFVAGGETVHINDATKIVGSVGIYEVSYTSDQLVEGLKVHVRGARQGNGSILATWIKVEPGEGKDN